MASLRRRRDAPIEPGTRIDKYQLVRHLGRGATGTVWLARHRILESLVAIKFLDAEAALPDALETELRGRFALEARVAALVGAATTRVVRAVDAGEHRGSPYLVMELVEGPSLQELIEDRGRLTPAQVADVVDQLAEGLDALHHAGFLHRDVKPANVVCSRVEPHIEVKLTDLGIVRRIDGSIASGPVTEAGVALGSPTYMSPEHLEEGRATDRASDLWSLGVTAYEALCGEVPFGGANLPEVVRSIRSRRARSPRSRVPELPVELDGFFVRSFAVDPARRWKSGAQMAAALRAALAPLLAPAPPDEGVMLALAPQPRASRAGLRRWAVLAAPLAAAVGSMAYAFSTWSTVQPDVGVRQAAPSASGLAMSGASSAVPPPAATAIASSPPAGPMPSASASGVPRRRPPRSAPSDTPTPAPRKALDPSEVF